MKTDALFLFAADLILFTHVLFVACVVFGLMLILIGGACAWSWVRNPWLRLAHLAAIGIVVAQAWLGARCPLTLWEMALRERAGDAVYPGDFIAYWLDAVLYYRAPEWVFTAGYTIFAVLVAAAWVWVRPESFRSVRR